MSAQPSGMKLRPTWTGGGGVVARLLGVAKKLTVGGVIFSCVWGLLKP
jgi:hypothetical protein